MLAAQKLFRCACHRYNFSQSKNRADKDVTIMNITNKVLISELHFSYFPYTNHNFSKVQKLILPTDKKKS